MSFLELVKKRYSVRAYKSKPVEDDKVQKVLEAARLAPTACNLQPFQFIVIRTKGREAELKRIYSASWFAEAPIVICACAIAISIDCQRKKGRFFSLVRQNTVLLHIQEV